MYFKKYLNAKNGITKQKQYTAKNAVGRSQRNSNVYTQHQYYNHHFRNNQYAINNVNRNEMYGTFSPEIDNRLKVGLDVSFPVLSYIMQITLAHVDKLTAEQSFILKVAQLFVNQKVIIHSI